MTIEWLVHSECASYNSCWILWTFRRRGIFWGSGPKMLNQWQWKPPTNVALKQLSTIYTYIILLTPWASIHLKYLEIFLLLYIVHHLVKNFIANQKTILVHNNYIIWNIYTLMYVINVHHLTKMFITSQKNLGKPYPFQSNPRDFGRIFQPP